MPQSTHDVYITRRNRFVPHSKITAICTQIVQNTDMQSVGRRYVFKPGCRQRVDFTRLMLTGKYASVRLIRLYIKECFKSFCSVPCIGRTQHNTRMQNLCLSGMAVTTEEEAERVDTLVHIHLTDVSHRHTRLFTSPLT